MPLPSFRRGRRLVLAVCAAASVLPRVQAQTASFPIRGNFAGQTNATLTAADWLLSGNTTVTSGHVELTAAVNGESGAAIYNLPFDSSSGVNVQFDYYMGGGTGADGLSIFLLDGSVATPTSGQPGGALGYAYSGASPGVSQAYLGVGFDRFGNYANSTYFAAATGGAGATLFPNTISIRGPATAANSNTTNGEYKFVAGSNVSYAVEGQQKVNLTIYAGKVTLRISSNGGITWTTIYNAVDFASSTAFNGYTLPSTLKIGFAASTGGSNDEHDIDDVLITMPVDLSVAFTSTPAGTPTVGSSVSYMFAVTNNGPNEDFGATMLYPVPPEITGVSWSYSIGGTGTGSGSGTGNAINASLDLPNGATATFTVTGTLGSSAAGQTLVNTATVVPSSSLGDTNPADNTVSVSTAVAAGPALSNSYSASGTYGTAFSYAVTATNNPSTFTATGLPPGLTINPSTGVISGIPTQAGTYTATIGASNANGSVSSSLAIAVAQAAPTVTWSAPAAIVSGTALSAAQLDATASVPGSFSYSPAAGTVLAPGANQVLGVTFIPTDTTDYAAATASTTIDVTGQYAQGVSIQPIANQLSTAAPISLAGSSTSGLPVIFTVVSGPAMLSGTTLTLTGAPGTVVVQVAQAGGGGYAAATATASFTVTAVQPIVYFGGYDAGGSGEIAVCLPAGTSAPPASGTLIGVLPSSASDGFVASFTTDASGNWTAATTSFGGMPLTLSGTLSGGAFAGVIAGTSAAFQAAADPVSGPTSALAGYYVSMPNESESGSVYSIVGTQGEVFSLVDLPGQVGSGLGAVAAGGSFQVQTSTGAALVGAIDPSTTTLSATLTAAGQAPQVLAGLSSATGRTDRLINLSSRANVGPGPEVLITGFVVAGAESKNLLIRGVGPGLAQFGLAGTLANPHLSLYNASGQLLFENAGWGGQSGFAAAAAQVGAFPLDSGGKDAAILVTLPPGSYSAQVSDPGSTGIALAEIYDASPNPTADYQRLINISSRGQVGSGANVLIGGFVVAGNAPKKVLIRGVGPGLAAYGLSGVLANPQITLFDANGNVVAANDDWGSPTPIGSIQVAASAADIAAANAATGAFALAPGSKDAALLLYLAPGAYSAQVSAADGGTGLGLLEVYEITP